MNRVIKINETDDRKVYFTADPHLWHQKSFIWEKRGYANYQQNAEEWIKTTNEIVRHSDILVVIGDFFLNTDESLCNETLSRIKCQNIYYISGNHENPLSRIYQREIKGLIDTTAHFEFENECEIYPFKYKNIIFMGNYVEMIVNGWYLILCHYPLHSWNKMTHGSIHLFGHLHCNNSPNDGKRMDVGWDGAKKPYSMNDILDIMDKKQIISDGGHH